MGLRENSDSEILEYAAAQTLIVVSHDVNTMPSAAYSRLAENRTMTGLLMVEQAEPVSAIISSLLLIWAASEAEEWSGVVGYLPL